MGILLFILLVVLVAVFGFWDTLGAVLGAAGVMVLVALLAAAIVALMYRVLLAQVSTGSARLSTPMGRERPGHTTGLATGLSCTSYRNR